MATWVLVPAVIVKGYPTGVMVGWPKRTGIAVLGSMVRAVSPVARVMVSRVTGTVVLNGLVNVSWNLTPLGYEPESEGYLHAVPSIVAVMVRSGGETGEAAACGAGPATTTAGTAQAVPTTTVRRDTPFTGRPTTTPDDQPDGP